MSVNRLPVGRIRAVHLPEGGPRVPKSLTIEYSDRSNASKWYQLEVPFVDAMHLLTLLQGAKDEVGYKERHFTKYGAWYACHISSDSRARACALFLPPWAPSLLAK